MVIAVIADIIGSRQLADRAASQRTLDATIAAVDTDLPLARRGLRPTFSDEQQGEFDSLEGALCWLLLLQLALPDEVQCRFGVGVGTVTSIPSASGQLAEGPAWWAAREAIDRVHDLQQRSAPNARIQVTAAADEPTPMHRAVTIANSYLLVRDQLVATMNERTRRLVYGRCLGRTQASLADDEGITQSAVSQVLGNAGAPAVIGGFEALRAQA